MSVLITYPQIFKAMCEIKLTDEEIDRLEKVSVYSFAFGDLVREIEAKYNLVWDIDKKEFKINKDHGKI